ncbi:MAG: DUF2877 domain-containing protein [Caldilineaceae bacterium]
MWRAISCSRLVPALLAPQTVQVQILSRHRHACNLGTAAGDLIALVSVRYGNGPFHLVVPDALFTAITLDTIVTWRDGALHFTQGCLTLAATALWDPQLPHLHRPVTTAQVALFANLLHDHGPSPLIQGDGPLQQRAGQAIASLNAGIRRNSLAEIEQGAFALAGLGPGLTPAGDDFLVGLLAALHSNQSRYANNLMTTQQLCTHIAQVAMVRTTKLSGAWLRYAGQGYFGEPWHDLIDALNDGGKNTMEQAVWRILQSGASSGADALTGFLAACALFP